MRPDHRGTTYTHFFEPYGHTHMNDVALRKEHVDIL